MLKYLLNKFKREEWVNYSEYLQTNHWKQIRRRKLAEVDFRCQVCNSSARQLHVHHRTYKRLGHEDMNDLTVLCYECHELFHSHGKLRW